eukprot:183521-Prorocentrum_lima.AAC.1
MHRIATVWRDALHHMCVTYGSSDYSVSQRRTASRWAFAVPGILLMRPRENDAPATTVPMRAVLRARLKLAETPN